MAYFKYTGVQTRALLLPAVVIAATAALMFAIAPGVNVDAISRGVVGPTTWPKTMMLGIIACAAVLLVRNVLRARMSSQRLGVEAATSADTFEEFPRDAPSAYDNRKAVQGILVILAYGAGIPVVGFAPATVAFIVLLLYIGGMRKPMTIGLVSIVGTGALLGLFVKVTAMPLDRGAGYFNDLNLTIYKMLGIY